MFLKSVCSHFCRTQNDFLRHGSHNDFLGVSAHFAGVVLDGSRAESHRVLHRQTTGIHGKTYPKAVIVNQDIVNIW